MGVYQQGVPIEITDTFTDEGVLENPTQLVYTFLYPDGSVVSYTWPGALEIENPSVGEFILHLDPPPLPGTYTYDVDATGDVETSRSGEFTVMANVADLDYLDYPITGPCTPWVDSQDVWECCGEPTVTVGSGSDAFECPVDMSPYALSASQLLYEMSGRIYSGICPRIVRPCGVSACGGPQFLSRGYVVWPGDYWLPGNWWGWTGSSWWAGDYNPCGCQPLSKVLLPGYPVLTIQEVKIDGAVVDPTTYELVGRRWLVRVRESADDDPLMWPSCQSMDLPDTEVGTFSVTYLSGMAAPLFARDAARQLACEIYRACIGSDSCALPSGTTRITRQGLTIERTFFARDPATQAWRTGLTLVDAFLNTANPGNLRRRPVVWSASGPRYAQSAGRRFT